jgi:hypothetical protein
MIGQLKINRAIATRYDKLARSFLDTLDIDIAAIRRCLRRPFRNKPSNDMAFPHPKSRKQHYRKEDKPNTGGVLFNFRTIDVTEYRNAADDVNPANDRTFGGIFHD